MSDPNRHRTATAIQTAQQAADDLERSASELEAATDQLEKTIQDATAWLESIWKDVHAFRREAGETFDYMPADQLDSMFVLAAMAGLSERHGIAETVQHLRDLANMLESADQDTLASVTGRPKAQGSGRA